MRLMLHTATLRRASGPRICCLLWDFLRSYPETVLIRLRFGCRLRNRRSCEVAAEQYLLAVLNLPSLRGNYYRSRRLSFHGQDFSQV